MYQLLIYMGHRKVAEGMTGADVTNPGAVTAAVAQILRDTRWSGKAAECRVEIWSLKVVISRGKLVGNYYPGVA
jgi:hypothetical protein